jgi:putative restriction endonuclease
MGLLDAAHLRGYGERGSNDPRNGLILCATHHRAFDKRLFGIDPRALTLVFRDGGPTAHDLGITRASINHLLAKPHGEALEWCWAGFAPDA